MYKTPTNSINKNSFLTKNGTQPKRLPIFEEKIPQDTKQTVALPFNLNLNNLSERVKKLPECDDNNNSFVILTDRFED